MNTYTPCTAGHTFFFFINNVLDKGLFLLNILNHFTASMKFIEHNNKSTNEPLAIINT